jgi:hypothetical protein
MTYAEDEPEDLIDLEAVQELRQQLGERKFVDIAHRLGGSAAVMGRSRCTVP